MKKLFVVAIPLLLIGAVTIGACVKSMGASQGQLLGLAQSRNLSPEDAAHAIKTFVPPGGRDEYLLFASGGHSGQIHVIGVPSMRLLKTIAVFTPEPWQGYGYGADWSEQALAGGDGPKEQLRWGDAHHPALSETAGKYDGRWLYINDRAHGRIGMVDLSDFRAKQILQVPNLQTSHGGIFATPDTQYVHISSKVPALKAFNASKGQSVTLDDHLNRYADIYRGYSTFVKVDPKTGRMLLKESFQIELPPYTQDLADAGKGVSDGYAFINSVQRRDGDRRHAAGQAAARSRRVAARLRLPAHHQLEEGGAGRRGRQVHRAERHPRDRLETAIAEGPAVPRAEPRSPHGVDIAPKGDYITVSGKLDPHTTVYGFDLNQEGDRRRRRSKGKDRYGIPILKFDAGRRRQGRARRGPLHTQYDNQGQRLHQPLSRERGRQVDAGRSVPSRGPGVQARRQGLDSLQHRPPRDDAGGHDGSAGQVPDRDEQVVDRPAHQRRAAPSAELPVDRHLGREDGAAGRHADRVRRAALRADREGRDDQGARRLPAR
jgi:nitrous-oxide reductase